MPDLPTSIEIVKQIQVWINVSHIVVKQMGNECLLGSVSITEKKPKTIYPVFNHRFDEGYFKNLITSH